MTQVTNTKTTTTPMPLIVTLAETKDFIKVAGTDDDKLIFQLIETAQSLIEDYLGTKLLQQTVELTFDCYPDGNASIKLPIWPIISVSSVDSQLIDQLSSLFYDYYLINQDRYPEIQLTHPYSWPSDDLIPHAGLKVIVNAGHALTIESIPSTFKLAVLSQVLDMYEYRENIAGITDRTMDIVSMYKDITL